MTPVPYKIPLSLEKALTGDFLVIIMGTKQSTASAFFTPAV